MSKMNDIREKLCRELDEMAEKGNFSMSDIDAIDKLTHSIKSIDAIEQIKKDMADYSNGNRRGYSANDRSMADHMGEYSVGGYSMGYPITYNGGYSMGYPIPVSYNMGDEYSRKRDAMGRYSRDDREERYDDTYSRHDGVGSKEQIVTKMRRMLGDAPDEKTRNALMSCLNTMEK
jgi:hypothetical protein